MKKYSNANSDEKVIKVKILKTLGSNNSPKFR